MSNALDSFRLLEEHLGQSILGQERLVQRLLLALLADGHLLVEGAPGLAKTRAVKLLGEHLEGEFHRIQFTPDLLPSDVTGTEIFRPQDSSFHFQHGPIFHNLVLADEINRSPAKVQSALLEAMGERQVTIGRETYFLPEIFMVMATQNPIEQEGTYPLPEAQLDRFLLHVKVGYPPPEKELEIVRLVRDESRGMLKQKNEGPGMQDDNRKTDVAENHKSQVCLVDQEQIKYARMESIEVYMSPEVERYQVELIQATRFPGNYHEELARWLEWGASPRASLALDRCSRAQAWLAGRDFVTPEDIQQLAHDVLRHRIILSYTAESEGIDRDMVIGRILELVPVP